MDFNTAFDRLIGNEGGYVNDPHDPGGETNWGISKRSYPTVDIRNLTKYQAKDIYKRDFWDAGKMERFHGAVAFQVFDIAVNHGIGNAIRMLQRAAGVADDGHVGPITISAVMNKTDTDMIMLIIAERIEFWTKLSTWSSFGKGWARRAATNLRYGAEDA